MRKTALTIGAGLLACGGLMFLAGCYEEIERDTPAPSAQAEPEPPAEERPPSSSDLGDRGASSAYGKAKESAKGTIEDVQDRNREVEEALPDY